MEGGRGDRKLDWVPAKARVGVIVKALARVSGQALVAKREPTTHLTTMAAILSVPPSPGSSGYYFDLLRGQILDRDCAGDLHGGHRMRPARALRTI